MAEKTKTKVEAPAQQGSDSKGGSEGFLHGLLTVLLSILIVLVVFGGAFYYVLKNIIAIIVPISKNPNFYKHFTI